jgi:MFS family permease
MPYEPGVIFDRVTLPVKGFFRNYFSRLKMFDRNVRLLLLGDLFIALGMTFWGLLFNLYLRTLAIQNFNMNPMEVSAFVGDIAATGQLAAAVFSLPAGILAARWNQKYLLILAHFLSSFAFIGAILSPGPMSIQIFVFISSLKVFNDIVTGPFVMRNSTPVERTYIFSLAFILKLGCGVFGANVAGAVKDWLAESASLTQIESYQWAILGGIALSMIGVIPFLFIRVPKTKEGAERKLTLSGWRKWDWKLFAKAIIPATILSTGAGLIVQFMTLYLKESFPGIEDRSIGMYMSFQHATMILGLILAPVLAEKLGKIRTIVSTQLLSVPFMFILAVTGDITVAVGAMVLRAALMNMSGPVGDTLTIELCRKEEQEIFTALKTMFWAGSWGMSGLIYGQMKEVSERIYGDTSHDYALMFFVAIGLYLTSTILYYVFFRNAEKEIAAARAAGRDPSG